MVINFGNIPGNPPGGGQFGVFGMPFFGLSTNPFAAGEPGIPAAVGLSWPYVPETASQGAQTTAVHSFVQIGGSPPLPRPPQPPTIPGIGRRVFFGNTGQTGAASQLFFPDDPRLAPYKGIILNGIRSIGDYNRAIELLKLLPTIVDDESREFARDIAAIVTEFEKVQQVKHSYDVLELMGIMKKEDDDAADGQSAPPGDQATATEGGQAPAGDAEPKQRVMVMLHSVMGKDEGEKTPDELLPSTSYCSRTAEQMHRNDKMFAQAIYLEHGAHLYHVIHEIVHAMPLEKLPPRFYAIHNPLGFHPDSDVPAIYASLVGNYLRDEARAGLGEIFLRRALIGAGIRGLHPRRFAYLKKGSEIYFGQGKTAYLDEGTYMGENHFVLYQLNGLYRLALLIFSNPDKLKDFVFSDNIERSGLWQKGQRLAIGEINFLELYQRFQNWLVNDGANPGDPLNPIRTRIREYLGSAAPVRRTARSVMEIEVELTLGDRPTPSPPGDPQRIARNPQLTKDKIVLIGTYAEFLDNLYQLSFAEVRANMRSYLRFAERCHPELAGMVYGRLYFVMKDAMIPPLESIELAHSLLRSGYATEGLALLDDALEKLGPIKKWDVEWNEILMDFHRAGRHEAVSKILDKVEEGRKLVHDEYREQILRAFDKHVWWRRGGRVKLRAVLDSHPYGTPDAMLYELIYALRFHYQKGRQYFRFAGFTETGEKQRHPIKISIDDAVEMWGGDTVMKYYQSREAALLHDLYEIQRDYLDTMHQGPAALFYLADRIQRDPMADRDETLRYLEPHFQRWKTHAATAKKSEIGWYREVSGINISPRADNLDEAMRKIYGTFHRRNMPTYEVETKHGVFSSGYMDDIEGDIFYAEALFIKTLLTLPGRFREALGMIETLPTTRTKATLFEHASRVVPEDFAGMEFDDFVASWRATIEGVAAGLPEWNFVESGQMRSRYKREPTVAMPSSARTSHFYLSSMRSAASFLLSRGDERYRASGEAIIRGLRYDASFAYAVRNTASRHDIEVHQPEPKISVSFSSAVEVARAWLALSDHLHDNGDADGAGQAAVRAAEILLEQNVEVAPDMGRLTTDFAETAIEAMERLSIHRSEEMTTRLYDKAEQMIRASNNHLSKLSDETPEWQNSKTTLFDFLNQDKELYRLADAYWRETVGTNYRNEKKDRQETRAEQIKKTRQAERDLISIGAIHVLSAMAADPARRDEALQRADRILAAFEDDIQNRNKFFPVQSLIMAADNLSLTPALHEHAVRAYGIAIRALELSRGTDENFERNVWTISKNIDESGLDETRPDTRDDIFTELVERLFPESRTDVWVSESAFSILSGNRGTPGIFDYVLREERYPKAEAALVHKAARVRDLVRFDRQDSIEEHAKKLFILREFFLRLSAHGEIFTERDAILKVLEDADPEVIAAFNAMFPRKETGIGRRVGGYPTFEAIRQGDFDMDEVVLTIERDLGEIMSAGAVTDRAREVFRAIGALLVTDMSVGRTDATIEALGKKRIFAAIYPHVTAYMEGHDGHASTPMQAELMRTILAEDDVQAAQVKAPLYLAIMREEGAPPELKALAFEGLHKSGEVSVYVYEALTKRIGETATTEEKLAWYGRWLHWNEMTRRSDDFSQSLYLEMQESDLQRLFAETEKRHGTGPHPSWMPLRAIWKRIDPMDMATIELFMFDNLVTDEDRRRAEAGIAVGGEGHVFSFSERWRQVAAEVAYVLAYHSATNLDGARRKFAELMTETAEETIPMLVSAYKSMYDITFYDMHGTTWTLDPASLEKNKGGPHERMVDIVEDIHKTIVMELAARFPDLETEFFSFNRHLSHIATGRGRAHSSDEIDELEEISEWDEDQFKYYIELTERLGHPYMVEYLETYLELLKELMDIFESENPQAWHQRALERTVHELRTDRQHLIHPDVLRRMESLRSMIPISDRPEKTYQAYLRRLRAWNGKRLRRIDRAEMAGIEMPEIIADRPSLTQFMGSRYFLELSVGERRVLMEELRNVPEGEAILRFFTAAGLHKVGQFLSVWPEVPEEIKRELSVLQDSVAPSNWEDVRQTIISIFGETRGNDLIRHIVVIDPETGGRCLKAGTIGEVYLVQWDDGRREILKIIPRGKRAKIVAALRRITAVRNRLSPNADLIDGGMVAMDILARIVQSMKTEIDLANDVRNAKAFEETLAKYPPEFRGRFVIPTFNEGYVDENAILMSFEDGRRITDIDDPKIVADAFSLLELLLYSTISESDMAPEDLHPGNFLVRTGRTPDDMKIVILDFGRMVHLGDVERSRIKAMVTKMISGEGPDAIVDALEAMSTKRPDYDRKALVAAIAERVSGVETASPEDVFAVVQDMLMIAGRHHLSVGEVYLKVLKAVSTFEGTKTSVRARIGGTGTFASGLNVSQADDSEESASAAEEKPASADTPEFRSSVIDILEVYAAEDIDPNSKIVSLILDCLKDGTIDRPNIKGPLLRLGVNARDLKTVIEELEALL